MISFSELGDKKGIHVSRQTLARWEKDETWPRRVRISPGRIGWVESEIDAAIGARCRRRMK